MENPLLNTLETLLPIAWAWVCVVETPTVASTVGGIIVMAAVAGHYGSKRMALAVTLIPHCVTRSKLANCLSCKRSAEMQVRQLDHVQLAMPAGREHEARAFYEGVLGIPEVVKPEHLARRGGCWFERAPLKVHLGVEEDFVAARKAHPAFIVDGLRELATNLQRAGYHVWKDQPLEGYDRLYVDDPFGNRIELMEPRR
jgi:catechol 2,3-dioxygenase-like lactoylglutathione lyase family enzyme